MSGKPWYNNGRCEIQVDVSKGEIVPQGYVREGSREQKKQMEEFC